MLINVKSLHIEQMANGSAKLVAKTDDGEYRLSPSQDENFHIEFTAVKESAANDDGEETVTNEPAEETQE